MKDTKKERDFKDNTLRKIGNYKLIRILDEIDLNISFSAISDNIGIGSDTLKNFLSKYNLYNIANNKDIDKSIESAQEEIDRLKQYNEHKNEIVRKSINNKDTISVEQDIIKFNIEKFKFNNKNSLKILEALEKEATTRDCFNCAYRERSISYCWYTIITNKVNNILMNKCNHYVDIHELLKLIKENNNDKK